MAKIQYEKNIAKIKVIGIGGRWKQCSFSNNI